MLAAVEHVLQALRSARTEGDLVAVLAATARRFGFASAYLVEYAGKQHAAERVFDTDAERRRWWPTYFASPLRGQARELLKDLGDSPVLYADASRFTPESAVLREMLAARNLVDVVYVTMDYEGTPVGIAGFCGTPKLTRAEEVSLQLLAYAIFSHMRQWREPQPVPRIALTPREREVIALSAEGLTSQQIATRLGMSARTANQHIDNVAEKLGTRNRAHTVAEVIRNGLLN
jgi:DNA-binding CsgD family transcriptional regulator